jgi:hypothetical protein
VRGTDVAYALFVHESRVLGSIPNATEIGYRLTFTYLSCDCDNDVLDRAVSGDLFG